MKLLRSLPSFLLGLSLISPLARAAEVSNPATLGFDANRLGRLDALIQSQVDAKKIAGVVLYIARDGQEVRHRAYGPRDVEHNTAMTTDSIFRIASMSKAVTSVAVMMLYEEGKLMLHDPVAKYIPEFADSVVAVAAPAGSKEKFVTVASKRPIEIRDLLTHMAGLTYGYGGPEEDVYKAANLQGWYLGDRNEPIGDIVKRLAKLPKHSQPGEAFDYGYATDVLGYLVEVVSGMPLDQFFAQRIFQPLKMVDTYFFLPPEKAARLAPVYGFENGKLALGNQGQFVDGPRKCFGGGAGLMSTASDYGRFLQMLLNRGELDGARVLSPKVVDLMHANHTGTKYSWDSGAFGLGFWVMEDVGRYGELASQGAYGWGSAYFPQYLVDPKERIVAVMMTQLMPTGGNDLNQKYKVMMYQALMK